MLYVDGVRYFQAFHSTESLLSSVRIYLWIPLRFYLLCRIRTLLPLVHIVIKTKFFTISDEEVNRCLPVPMSSLRLSEYLKRLESTKGCHFRANKLYSSNKSLHSIEGVRRWPHILPQFLNILARIPLDSFIKLNVIRLNKSANMQCL